MEFNALAQMSSLAFPTIVIGLRDPGFVKI